MARRQSACLAMQDLDQYIILSWPYPIVLPSGRLKHHRNKSSKVKGGRHMEATYVAVPDSLPGKSVAVEVESAVINQLQNLGFPLLSVTDGRTRRVSKSGQGAAS